MDFLKRFRDFNKVKKVILSCENWQQAGVALNTVYNFGKIYGFDRAWSKLDTIGSNIYIEMIEQDRYKERICDVVSCQ